MLFTITLIMSHREYSIIGYTVHIHMGVPRRELIELSRDRTSDLFHSFIVLVLGYTLNLVRASIPRVGWVSIYCRQMGIFDSRDHNL